MNAGQARASGRTDSTWHLARTILRPWRRLIVLIAISILVAETLAIVPALLMRRIVDDHLTAGIASGLLTLALLYLTATAGARGVDFAVVYLTAYVAQSGLRDLRVRLVNHLLRLPLSYYDHTPRGDAISRCTADVETVDTLFTTGVASLITRLAQLITATAAMFALSPRLAAFALLLLPPLAVITRFFQIHIRDAERDQRRSIGRLNTQLEEVLSGVEVVRAFHMEGSLLHRFRQALRDTVRAYGRALSYNVFYTPLLTVLVAVCVALLLWAGTGGMGWNLGTSIGTLTAFVLLFQRFYDPIRNLGEDWQTVQSALSGIERIVQVLRVPLEERRHGGQAGPGPSEDGLAIEITDVQFGYLSNRPVLRAVTLHVQAGEHVAIVGRTGSGKTSAVRLLAGLYTPWTGTVRVAGQDPAALSDDQRRQAIGVVPQTVQLFSGSVLDNLTLGDTAVSQEQVERATQMTGVDRIIATLPQGAETVLQGEGGGEGVQLSEGQRQLLTLTRALVWDPAVLLLDEATAAVDSVSEAAFAAALRRAMHGRDGRQRAVITVAHRLSRARDADRVIVMENGRIVDEGAPDELLARGGRFAAMVELEQAGWDWRAEF